MSEPTETAQISAPILALDLGERRVGIALSDALAISIRPLDAIYRTNWKQLLRAVQDLVHRFDAKTVVIGLPLSVDGSEREPGSAARRTAEKFAQSLTVPVYLQDERLTSVAAREKLIAEGVLENQIDARIDSESAVVILKDFLTEGQNRILVETTPGRDQASMHNNS